MPLIYVWNSRGISNAVYRFTYSYSLFIELSNITWWTKGSKVKRVKQEWLSKLFFISALNDSMMTSCNYPSPVVEQGVTYDTCATVSQPGRQPIQWNVCQPGPGRVTYRWCTSSHRILPPSHPLHPITASTHPHEITPLLSHLHWEIDHSKVRRPVRFYKAG